MTPLIWVYECNEAKFLFSTLCEDLINDFGLTSAKDITVRDRDMPHATSPPTPVYIRITYTAFRPSMSMWRTLVEHPGLWLYLTILNRGGGMNAANLATRSRCRPSISNPSPSRN